MVDDDTVIRVLNQHRLLSPFMLSQAQRIQTRSKQPLFIVLLENNLVDEAKSLGALSAHMTTSCVSLSDYVGTKDLLRLLPRSISEKFRALPLGVMEDHGGRRLVTAMCDPSDFEAVESLSTAAGIDIEPVLVGPRDFQAAFARSYPPDRLDEDDEDGIALPPANEITLPEPDLASTAGPADNFIEGHSLAPSDKDHVVMGGAASAEHTADFSYADDEDPLPWERYDGANDSHLAGLLERTDHSTGPFSDDPVFGDAAFDDDDRSPTAESSTVAAPSNGRAPTEPQDMLELPEPRAQDDSGFGASDRSNRQRSNVFRQFMRKSSVIVLGPPTKAEMPDLDSIPPRTVLKAVVELLLEKGLFELYEFEQAVAALQREGKAK